MSNRDTGPAPAEIIALRLAAGLTQSEMAVLLHSAVRSVQDWEGGRRRMHPAFWELARIKSNALFDITRAAGAARVLLRRQAAERGGK